MAELNDKSIQALIGSLSITDDQAAAFNSAEDVKKHTSEFFNTRNDASNATFLELKLNDPDFGKSFYDKGYTESQGRYMNQGRETAKSFFGLSKDDVYGDDGKGKDLKEIFQTGVDKLKIEKGNGDITKIQEEHAAARQVWDTEKSSLSAQIETGKSDHLSYVNRQKISGLLKDKLMGVDRLKHGLDDATMLFMNKLNGFKIGLTEAGELEFKTEAGTYPEIDNKVVKSSGEYINHLCEKWEWIAEEKDPKPKPKTITGNPGTGEPEPVLNRQQRARAKAQGYDPRKD